MISGDKFIFWKYSNEYGVRRGGDDVDAGELIGFRDDAPEEVKKSWEEYLEFERKNQELGLKWYLTKIALRV